MAPDAVALGNLDTIVESAVALLKQLQAALAEIHRDPTIVTADRDKTSTVDAVKLAYGSASLIRAHSTKLSLLLINEPFTPSAIISVIRELCDGPLPGIAAALEACRPDQYTTIFRKELAWRCKQVLVELTELFAKVPKDGKSLAGSEQTDFKSGDKGSVALTGLLWAACDSVIELTSQGAATFFVKQVEEWRDTLKDVMEELKGWGDEEPVEDDNAAGKDDYDADSGHEMGAQDMIDDMMEASSIPKSDPDKIRPRLEFALKRLRLVTLLYQAVVKRRVKKLPALPVSEENAGVPARLEKAMAVLKVLPDHFGDLACAFYELQPEEIDELMDTCFQEVLGVSELLGQGWDGGSDEFTEWNTKFRAEIQKD